MGVEFNTEGSTCGFCKKESNEVGAVRQYQEHEISVLLCESCITEFENDKCADCHNIRNQSEKDIANNLCRNCEQLRERKQGRNKARNKKLKQNVWKFTKVLAVVLTIMVCAIVIGEFVETLQ